MVKISIKADVICIFFRIHFYKQHFYKQRHAELANAKQHPEATLCIHEIIRLIIMKMKMNIKIGHIDET